MTQLPSTNCFPGLSLSATWDSSASAGTASSSDANSAILFTASPLGDLNVDPLYHVVVVASGVEIELEGLTRTDSIGRACHDRVGTRARCRDDVAPLPPGEASQIGPELRRPPALAAILRDLHSRNPKATVPSYALHLDGFASGE